MFSQLDGESDSFQLDGSYLPLSVLDSVKDIEREDYLE